MAKRGSGKNGKKTVWTVLAVVSVLILIVCGVSIARQVIQIQQQRQLDGEMSQIARPSQDPERDAGPHGNARSLGCAGPQRLAHDGARRAGDRL